MLILKGVKVICFDTLLQVLILKELEGNITRGQSPAHLPVAHCAGAICGGDALLLGYDPVSEKKKREKAPAGKAQIFTRFMIAEGLRQVKGNSGGVLI